MFNLHERILINWDRGLILFCRLSAFVIASFWMMANNFGNQLLLPIFPLLVWLVLIAISIIISWHNYQFDSFSEQQDTKEIEFTFDKQWILKYLPFAIVLSDASFLFVVMLFLNEYERSYLNAHLNLLMFANLSVIILGLAAICEAIEELLFLKYEQLKSNLFLFKAFSFIPSVILNIIYLTHII